MMRLGGPLFQPTTDPDAWIAELRRWGYTAAYCPLDPQADGATIRAYERAARAANIVIAEVGAWRVNPISADAGERRAAIAECQRRLALADEIGARCCVSLAGSRGERWNSPHPDNLTDETFDLIVQTAREIIDAVRPRRACYALETMPWAYPDSPENYLRLVRAIDRPGFAVHLDPVNMISSPQRYFRSGALIRACIGLLGPYIKSCHAKDIALGPDLTVRLSEVRPLTGGLDYPTLLRELSRLDADTPLMLEHLDGAEAYRAAAGDIRAMARRKGIALQGAAA